MNENTNNRMRTFSWSDPQIGAKKAQFMSGFDYLNTMCDPESDISFPPIMDLFGVDTASVSKGHMRLEFTAKEYHYNTIGGVHGGVFCTLLDSVMSCAVHTTLPQGVGFTTLELKVNFLRPISMDAGLIFCEGNVIQSGHKAAFAEGKIVNADGKLFATGHATCLIFKP